MKASITLQQKPEFRVFVVHLSVRWKESTAGWILAKFYTGDFYETPGMKFKHCLNQTEITGMLHEDLCTFMTTLIINITIVTLVTKVTIVSLLTRFTSVYWLLWFPDCARSVLLCLHFLSCSLHCCMNGRNAICLLYWHNEQNNCIMFIVLMQWTDELDHVYCTNAMNRWVAICLLY